MYAAVAIVNDAAVGQLIIMLHTAPRTVATFGDVTCVDVIFVEVIVTAVGCYFC